MFEQLKEWKHMAKRDAQVSYLALRDPRAPWYIKALAVATAVYALSPIDIIPDFIPFAGVIDDIIVIPVAIVLMVRLIPMPLKTELQEEAEFRMASKRPRSRVKVAVVTLVVVGLVVLVVWLVWFR